MFLLGFVIFSLGAWGKKEPTCLEAVNVPDVPFKDLSHKFLIDGIQIDDDSLDLVFDYKLYKKLLIDNILDNLILDAGFEPNDENRMIFFSVISKDLQQQIKRSFSRDSENKNHDTYSQNNAQYRDMQYQNMQYQTEMTRSMLTLAQTAISSMKKSENKGKYGLAFGGFIALLMAEFGFFGKAVKISNWFFNAKDKIHDFAETVAMKSTSFWGSVKSNTVENTFLKHVIYRDFTKGDPVAENFIKNYERFKRTIKDDKEIVQFLGKCKKILLCDRNGKVLVCPDCKGPDDLFWDVRDCSKK